MAGDGNPIIRAWRGSGCDERCEFLAHLRDMYSLAMIEDFWRRYDVGARHASPESGANRTHPK